MSASASVLDLADQHPSLSPASYLHKMTDDLLASLPPPQSLSASERRGLIARYTAVLEGNFIYWMTGALLAVQSDESRAIIIENLLEEVRDSHPAMLRRFVVAANTVPTDTDALAVAPTLLPVRLFVGHLSAAPILAMMAFFEGFIQRFMPYLEDLAQRQGSAENEYTQVHGVCDIAHSEGLYRALDAERALIPDSLDRDDSLYEGVHLLRELIGNIFTGRSPVTA